MSVAHHKGSLAALGGPDNLLSGLRSSKRLSMALSVRENVSLIVSNLTTLRIDRDDVLL